MLPDEELHYLKALQNGDQQAIEMLVEEYYPALKNFLLRLGCPPGDIEDIIQETLIKVTKGVSHYQHKERFRAWLFKICHNTYRDYCKKASRRREFPHDPLTLETCAGSSPEALAIKNDQTRQVQEILNRLPDRQRLVIVLRYYHQFSIKEIAQVVRCPAGTAKSRLNSGLRMLKSYLEEVDT